MIWIEIIGPSGVGKSYWYKKFMDKYPEYNPKRILINRIKEGSYYNQAPLWLKVCFYFIKIKNQRISLFFENKIFSWYLNKFESFDKNIYNLNDEIIIQQYLESISKIKEPNISIIKKIEYFAFKVREYKFYDFFLKEDDIFISEDGLQHLHPVYCEFLNPNLYFHLDLDLEIIKKQRIKRSLSNPTTFTEFLVSTDELIEIIEDYYKTYNIKIDNIYKDRLSNIKKVNVSEDVIKKLFTEIMKFK